MTPASPPPERNHGPQPLDQFMVQHELTNADLVAHSTEHLTHKQVQKGRKGRALTRNIQGKILRALRVALENETLSMTDLFSYRGR